MIELTRLEARVVEEALERAAELDEYELYPEFSEALEIIRACNIRAEQEEIKRLLDEDKTTTS